MNQMIVCNNKIFLVWFDGCFGLTTSEFLCFVNVDYSLCIEFIRSLFYALCAAAVKDIFISWLNKVKLYLHHIFH